MSIILLAALLASLLTWGTVAALISNGETRRARRIFFCWSAGAGAYFVILIATAMMPRQSAFKAGTPYCEDDVCMSVEKITRTDAFCRLDVRLFSRANHGPRSTRGASVYLTDERNRRYLPLFDRSAIPFDTTLQPGQSFGTSLTFEVPREAKRLFFAASMDQIRYASFIIGSPDLLRRPLLVVPIR